MRLKEEAVSNIACVNVVPRNPTCRVYARGVRTLKRACSSAWSVYDGDSTVGGAPKTVEHVVRVKVGSHYHSRRVDVHAAICWDIENGD